MSDAARHAAYFVPESVYGTTPDTPSFSALRHTGLSLGVQRGSLQSEELRPDRQIADFRLGAVSVVGDIVTELSFSSFDALLEAVLLGTWTPKATKTAITLSATASDDSFNDSGNAFVTLGYQVGDLIAVSGFTDSANNGTFRIASVAAGKITVTDSEGSAVTLVDEAAGDSVTIATTETVLKAGTTRRSFSLLRHFTDITASGDGLPFHLFRGVELNTLALSINPNAIVSATFGTLGREGVTPANSAPAGSTFGAASTSAPLDAFTGALTSDGSPLAIVTEFSINLENGLEVRPVVGSKLTIRPSIGRSNVTGSATVYFEDGVFLKKFADEEDVSLSIELPDGAGNSYVIEVPKFNFTGGQPDVSGQGSITLSMPFKAVYDPTTATNLIIRRIPAAA